MDIIEIRARYLVILAEKCAKCFNNIDSILVGAYNQIMKHEQIEIPRNRVSYDGFTEIYHDDMVKEIINHYSENWNITYGNKGMRKKEKVFTFSYKGDLEVDIQESTTEVKEVIDKDVEIKEFKTDRCSILDLK